MLVVSHSVSWLIPFIAAGASVCFCFVDDDDDGGAIVLECKLNQTKRR